MNIFEVNQMLKQSEDEYWSLKERWEMTDNEEDKHSVAVKLLEIQILQEWLEQCKKDMKK